MLFFIMLGVTLIYLFTNIKFIFDGSSALILLMFSIFIGTILLILDMLVKKRIYMKKSFFFLTLFLTYFICSLVLSRPEDIKSYTIATTGGIILFYLLGVLISLNLEYIKEKVLSSNQFLKFFNSFYFIFVVSFIVLLIDTSVELASNIRGDLFLIVDPDGMYQRAGNFLIISSLIFSFITMFFLIVNKYIRRKTFVKLISFSIYLLSSVVLFGIMLLSQLIGSNNTLVNITGLLLSITVFYVLLNFVNSKKLLNSVKFNIKKIFFSRFANKLLKSIFLSIFIFIFILIFMLNIVEIDLDKLRIFGFGSGEISSINSRLALWGDFTSHFNYNPIFGNMAVDKLTTGEGKYVHSFIGSLFTHLGIIGFILFFIYLFNAIKEKLNYNNNLYFNNVYTLYSLLVLTGILGIASFGTFFTWIPIWFLMGLIFPPIEFKDRKEIFK
ncbi:hypothetical protein [Malaciobacter halophilus]|nr:hypothetical protein [Malaciobacter halophilus]